MLVKECVFFGIGCCKCKMGLCVLMVRCDECSIL